MAATLLTLLVVPVVYSLAEAGKGRFMAWWTQIFSPRANARSYGMHPITAAHIVQARTVEARPPREATAD